MRAVIDPRVSGLKARALQLYAWHDRLSLTRGEGSGCTASNKTLCARLGCDYTTLIKLRKELEADGYIQLEPRQGGKRLEVVRVIPDHLAAPESWPFDQSYIGPNCLEAWQGAVTNVGEIANNEGDEVGEIANAEPGKVGDANSETHGNQPKTGAQYIPLEEGETYPPEGGGRYSSEEAHFAESARSGEPVCRDKLRLSVMFASNLLGSQREIASRAGVQTGYVSKARNGQPVPESAARALLEASERVCAGQSSHAPTKPFGRFGYYLPANFEEAPTGTQLARLERALHDAQGTNDLRQAREQIADYLLRVCDDLREDGSDHRALRMAEALDAGVYG
jgi:hypothetical protein